MSKYIKTGLHLERQKYNTDKKAKEFNQELVKQQNKTLNNPIVGFGLYHTEAQSRSLEALQKLYTDTNYQGNADAMEIYDNKKTTKLPVIRFTPKEFLDAYGAKQNQRNTRDNAIKALESLGTHQYFFYYERLEYDEKGEPKFKRNGESSKETVTTIDTLIKIRKVYNDDQTRKRLKYYEVFPSMIFVDQIGLEEWDKNNIGNHFLLKPAGWREEIKLKVGSKASKYTYEFINWLMVQYEDRRRSKGGYTIKMGWKSIAFAIKIPDKVIKRSPKQALGILHKAYAIAQDLGYLASYELGSLDTLLLTEEKFFKPGGEG